MLLVSPLCCMSSGPVGFSRNTETWAPILRMPTPSGRIQAEGEAGGAASSIFLGPSVGDPDLLEKWAIPGEFILPGEVS